MKDAIHVQAHSLAMYTVVVHFYWTLVIETATKEVDSYPATVNHFATVRLNMLPG